MNYTLFSTGTVSVLQVMLLFAGFIVIVVLVAYIIINNAMLIKKLHKLFTIMFIFPLDAV